MSIFTALIDAGFTREVLTEVFATAGYAVPQSTMYKWQAKKRADAPLFSPTNSAGRPRTLTEAQENLVVGFVLHENSLGRRVRRSSVQAFILDNFQIKMHETTVGRFLGEKSFVMKEQRTKGSGTTLSHPDEVDMAFDFVKTLRLDGTLLNVIRNIDCTYTTRRHDDTRGYGLLGARDPALTKKISPYTNCIVTCFSSDGTNTPSMLFTTNPAFHTDSSKHRARKASRAHLTACLEKYHINRNRIYFIEGDKSKFVSEKADFVRIFLAHHKLDAAPIFSDGGAAFTAKEGSVIEQAGYKHVVLPAAVHQYLSVNDNIAHAVAKARQRALNLDYTDDVDASLALLNCLDNLPADSITGWFTRNYMLDCENLIRDDFERLIVGPPKEQRRYHDMCLQQYRVRFAPITTNDSKDAYETWSELDGLYWVL